MSLVRKELREHGWVVAGLLLLDAALLAGLLVDSNDAGGRFVALTRFVVAAGSVNAVIFAGRLFVREFSARTQLFLEVLPISRGRVLATKWLLGALAVAGVDVLAWALTWWWQGREAVISAADARRALVGTLGFAVAFWSFAALVALLGRYRWVAWGVAVLAAWALESLAKVELAQLALFRLVGSAAAMARGPWPSQGLAQAALVVGVCVTASMALTLVGPGAVAALLAQRMTPRERAFIAGAGLVSAFVASVLARKPEKPPFQLASAAPAVSKHAVVGVGTSDEFSEAAARALGASIAADVDALIDTFHLTARPTIFVLPQQGLDADAVERAKLGDASGVVLRMAPRSPSSRVRAMVVHALLVEATHERALLESRHVLLDGVSAWWVLRHEAEAREREWLRLAAGPEVTAQRLEHWETTMERAGPCLADALAFASADALVRRLGEAPALALFEQVFAPAPRDVRALFAPSIDQLFERAGVGWATLAESIERERLGAQQRFSQSLAKRAALTASVLPTSTEGRGRTLEATLVGASTWSAVAAKAKPWSRELDSGQRVDARASHVTLPLTLSAGDRVWVALETQDDVLDCRVRVFSERVEVP